AKTRRIFEKFDLQLQSFFEKPEILSAKIIEKYIANKTAHTFDQTEKLINIQLKVLKDDLSQIDPTLAVALANRTRKINYHINAIRAKFHRSELRRNEVLQRQLNTAFATLYPHNGLQERTLNVTSFLARYGLSFMKWLFQSIDADTREHQIFSL
ncbi:MAG: bacillithiol biosynthesis BshC, partial [Pyrinomonadaceae bacterium]|nr:bacillithiol biosynthesis BshC [Pyrinomonadaceae bacterium]